MRIVSGGQALSLGGAGAIMEVRHQHDLGGTLQPGNNTGWTDGGIVRYAGDVATIPGVSPWGNGSGGGTPNRGYIHTLGMGWKRARNTAATNTPIDWYSGACAYPILAKPPVDLLEDFQVWEFGATIMLDALPTGTIDRDMGMVCILSSNTSFASYLRAGVAAGNDFAGFGVVWNGANGELLWIVKKSGASGGAALTESVSLGIYGALRPVPVRIRFYSATRTTEARVEVWLDGAPRLTRSWGVGSVLPTPADATFQATLGYYRCMLRAAQTSANLSALLWRQEYMRAARSAELLG